jgi:hypothetical protein
MAACLAKQGRSSGETQACNGSTSQAHTQLREKCQHCWQHQNSDCNAPRQHGTVHDLAPSRVSALHMSADSSHLAQCCTSFQARLAMMLAGAKQELQEPWRSTGKARQEWIDSPAPWAGCRAISGDLRWHVTRAQHHLLLAVTDTIWPALLAFLPRY